MCVCVRTRVHLSVCVYVCVHTWVQVPQRPEITGGYKPLAVGPLQEAVHALTPCIISPAPLYSCKDSEYHRVQGN